jgi:uncharacterized protein YqgC (DUF456 family)
MKPAIGPRPETGQSPPTYVEDMIETVLLWLLVAVLVAAGILGLVVPMLPGAPLLFAGLLVAAWIEDFAYVGPWTLTVLAFMAVLTYVVDFGAGALGAKGFGATKYAMVGAFGGALVGILFGLPGIILGTFLGAVAGELFANRSLRDAGAAGLGATIGLAVGVAAKMALAVSMLSIFVFMRLWGAVG